MAYLALIRHGQSEWNLQNRFTGWVDVDLTEQGRAEAKKAGALLKKTGAPWSAAYTSVQKRAIRTLNIALDEMDMMWLPVIKSWRLNERHYGGSPGSIKKRRLKSMATRRSRSGGAAMTRRRRRSMRPIRSTRRAIRATPRSAMICRRPNR